MGDGVWSIYEKWLLPEKALLPGKSIRIGWKYIGDLH